MKIKALVVSIVMTFSMSVQATTDELGEFDYCQYYATQVEYMAKWRDDGMPKAEMIAALERSDYTGSILKVLKRAVDVAFEYPKFSPKEEGNTAYKRCLKVML